MKRKLLPGLFFALLLSLLYCIPSLADVSGSCGDHLTWTYVENTLTISGTGPMDDYSQGNRPGWYDYSYPIQTIVIQEGVTSIGRYAFADCRNVPEITIPDTVTGIADYAFAHCSQLFDIYIYNPDTIIAGDAFYYCGVGNDSVSHFSIYGWADSAVETYASHHSGIFFHPIYGYCGDNLVWHMEYVGDDCNVVTVSGTGPMWNYHWENNPSPLAGALIKTLVVSSGVTSIGEDAFGGNNGLTNVTLPSGLISIGRGAFSACGFTGIEIPEGVVSIGDGAFVDCNNLTDIYIPASVSVIGEYAFYRNSSLTSAVVCNPNVVFGNDVFGNFSATTLILRGWNPSTAKDYADAHDDIIFEALGTISGQCGDNLIWELDPVTGVLMISGSGTMADYTTSVHPEWYDVRDYIKAVDIRDGVQSIGDYAFFNCDRLTEIQFGTVTGIGTGAFRACTGLTAAVIPDSVTSLGNYAFLGCEGLSEVKLSGSITVIGYRTFYRCTSLNNVLIPDGVAEIGENAFSLCSALDCITISGSVTSIGSYTFQGCSVLAAISCNRGSYAAEWAVPHGYKVVILDPDFFLPEDLTRIETEAFTGIEAQAVIIPECVTAFEGNPFANSGLLTVYGYPGSAAEDWAADYGYMFVPIDNAWMSNHKP